MELRPIRSLSTPGPGLSTEEHEALWRSLGNSPLSHQFISLANLSTPNESITGLLNTLTSSPAHNSTVGEPALFAYRQSSSSNDEADNQLLQAGIDASFTSTFTQTNSNTITLPQSLNETAFNAAGLDDAFRLDGYCCAISHELMTDPVYFIDVLNQRRFERAQIMEWLKQHDTHPLSRERVTASQLVSDEALKAEIPEYISNLAKSFEEEKESTRALHHPRI